MTGAPASATGGSGRPAPGGELGAAATGSASLWNVANLLTMIRLLLVPGFIALMLAGGGYDPAWRSLAWAAFAVAMITDLFDGHLARTYNLVTDFGKIADPIADKAIMGTALICLSALDELPWWVTGVILGRELGITLLRFVVIRYGVIPASRGGKLKTLAQGTAVGMYILALTGPLATLRFWVMAVAVVLTVATGLDYVKRAMVLRRQGRARARSAAGAAQPGPAGATQAVLAEAPGATVAEAAQPPVPKAQGEQAASRPSTAAGRPATEGAGAEPAKAHRVDAPTRDAAVAHEATVAETAQAGAPVRPGTPAARQPVTGRAPSGAAGEAGAAQEPGAEVTAGERRGEEPQR